jgi:hypothetical protein
MTKTKQNLKVVPSQVDGIPIEVANEMLFSPKVRLSNRMRKNCMKAREKVYSSDLPIRKVRVPDDTIEGEEVELQYLPNARKPEAIKLAAKAAKLTYVQLLSHHKRADRRKARAQKNYLRLMQSDAPEKIKRHMGAALTAQAERFERDKAVLATEIQIRGVNATSFRRDRCK